MLTRSLAELEVLSELGDSAMRSILPGEFAGGRAIPLMGQLDPKASVVPNTRLVLGMTERLKVRRYPSNNYYRGVRSGGWNSYEEYDVERIYTPPFRLVLENGVIPVVNRDYTIDHAHELSSPNNPQLRCTGFGPDATILVIGRMTDKGFVARAVTDVSLADYRQRLQNDTDATRSWGCGWTVLGSSLL